MTEQPTGIPARVREFLDRSEITELVNRYIVLLDTQDEHGFDDTWPHALFTEDVTLDFPVGSHTGLAGVAEFHLRAKSRYLRTHHMATTHTVTPHGDLARVRCQVLATHVWPPGARTAGGEVRSRHLVVGGHHEGEAVRTPDGWRLRRWACRVAWHDGTSPVPLD